jgi:hypothetical protein
MTPEQQAVVDRLMGLACVMASRHFQFLTVTSKEPPASMDRKLAAYESAESALRTAIEELAQQAAEAQAYKREAGPLLMGLAVIRELTGTQQTDNIDATIDAVRAALASQPLVPAGWSITFSDERDFCRFASILIGATYTSGADALARFEHGSLWGERTHGNVSAAASPAVQEAPAAEHATDVLGVPASPSGSTLQASPSAAIPDARTATDYALEHAEYLAKGAEQFIEDVNLLAQCEQQRDELQGDDPEGVVDAADHAIDSAKDGVDEGMRSLRNRIYEFRKRHARATDRREPATGEPGPAGTRPEAGATPAVQGLTDEQIEAIDQALRRKDWRTDDTTVADAAMALTDRLASMREFYGQRYKVLFDWAHRELNDDQKTQYFNIVANGTPSVYEAPEYAQQFNLMKHRAEAAEAEVERLRALSAPEQAAQQAGARDAARLDWLESAGATVELVFAGQGRHDFRVGGILSSRRNTLRAAIDAAMAASKKEG